MIPYRNREQPYDHTDQNKEDVDYFITNPVAKWIDSYYWRSTFSMIYGYEALNLVREKYWVPENIDKNQIWNGDKTKQVWGGEEDIVCKEIHLGEPAYIARLEAKIDKLLAIKGLTADV
jgi:hypothetical protein